MTATPPLHQRLRQVFGHSDFRPHQEEVCLRTAAGDDGLVVMPTGAGKSLCYQLPGLLRGGPTLVFSPLKALMEDQTAKLRELGLRAERIHSGRPRHESRQACRLYRDGELDFLFIAPERLGVPGFIEFLERCRPALIAVDEAHCISQWGHDFRPDYRLLGQRLPRLRPAPVLALTATATPRIQDDIADQLDLHGDQRYIYGFRRENLAVEAVQKRPGARAAIVCEVLGEPGRRPAIVYAPTRKETEKLAGRLADEFPAAAYHAGLPTAERDDVQTGFLGGGIEVVVATTAFGMGIDKPDIRTVIHTAMPATVEGYYQEIGRAGRDGQPARALLLYSWADRRTQEFLHKRSYPEIAYLKQLHKALTEEPQERTDLQRRLCLGDDVFEAALDQLRIHGGAVFGGGYRVRRGDDSWVRSYRVQRQHRLDQIDEMTRFADHRGCGCCVWWGTSATWRTAMHAAASVMSADRTTAWCDGSGRRCLKRCRRWRPSCRCCGAARGRGRAGCSRSSRIAMTLSTATSSRIFSARSARLAWSSWRTTRSRRMGRRSATSGPG